MRGMKHTYICTLDNILENLLYIVACVKYSHMIKRRRRGLSFMYSYVKHILNASAPIANQSIDCWIYLLMYLCIYDVCEPHVISNTYTIKRLNNLFYSHIFSDKYVMYKFSISLYVYMLWVCCRYIRNAIICTENWSGHKQSMWKRASTTTASRQILQ